MPTTSPHKPRWLVILIIAGLCLQLGWYYLIFSHSLNQPEYLRRVDFSIFYTSGRIAREEGWSKIYSLQEQLDMQSNLVGRQLALDELLPFNHPPVLLPVQVLFSGDDYIQSYQLWVAFQVLILLATGIWIFQIVRRLGWDILSAWLFSIECVLFHPMFVGLVKGQDTSLALFGLVVCLSGLLRNNDREAGLGLSLLVIRPQLALPLALPFVFKQRKVWWWFLGSALFLSLFSLFLVGFQGVQDFLTMLVVSTNGEQVVIHSFDMFNLKGMLIRLFPALEMTTIPVITWGAYLLGIILLCVWWSRSTQIGPRQLGVAIVMVLFISPHLHYHDLGLLLIPIIALCVEFVRKNLISPLASTALILGISLYLVIIQLTPLKFMGVYLLMVFLAFVLWYQGERITRIKPLKEIL